MSKKKIVALIIAFVFLSLPVFKNENNDTLSFFCRDNPYGSSSGIIAVGFISAKDDVKSVVNFASCDAGRDVESIIGISVSNAKRQFVIYFGIPIGNAGVDLKSFFGIPIGNAGRDLGSVIGIPIGNAEKNLVSLAGISFGHAGQSDSNGLLSVRFDGWGKPPHITGFWEGY